MNSLQLLLDRCCGDDPAAFDALLRRLYGDLHGLAQHQLRRERSGHTLQPTALVHEAFLRIARQRKRSWNGADHFLATAATAMRRTLVRHAERRAALKRGGAAGRCTLSEATATYEERAGDLVALDEALEKLASFDPEKARIVELRFFAGLSADRTARELGVSTRTLERHWRVAKAWLRRELAA